MKIYQKTVIILAITLSLLVGMLFITSEHLLMESYGSLEAAATEEQTLRALSALDAEIAEINAYAIDWAEWDDTYRFIQDRNAGYIRSNIVNETFTNFQLNLLLYLDQNGTVVLGEAFDLDTGTPLNCSEGCVNTVITKIRADKQLSSHDNPDTGFGGIVIMPGGPMIFASQPIRTSRGEGPVQGTLIMGRYLTGKQVANLEEVTHFPITIDAWDTVLADAHTAGLFAGGEQIVVDPANSSVISGYAVVVDVRGRPALLMRIDLPRAISNQGEATLLYFLGWLLLAGTVFGIVTVALLKQQIISRISRLHRGVSAVTGRRDFSTVLPVEGDDEIADFAEAVNRMLAEITSSHHELRESRDRYQLLFNSGNDFVIVFSITADEQPDRILKANNLASVRLGYGTEGLSGLPVARIVNPHAGKKIPKSVRNGTYEGEELFRTELLTADGETIPVEVNTHRITLDGQQAVLAMARDVTQRVRAERELELYRLNLEELVELRTTELRWANTQLVREIRDREATERELEQYRLHLEEMVEKRTNDLTRTTEELRKEIEERELLEKQKMEAYTQIAKNMEQFAILNDHIRNPLQVIVGIASLADDENTDKIIGQATVLNEIITRLDRGWIESEKIRAFLRKHYGED
jgi:PAS domain S-box-containing protein